MATLPANFLVGNQREVQLYKQAADSIGVDATFDTPVSHGGVSVAAGDIIRRGNVQNLVITALCEEDGADPSVQLFTYVGGSAIGTSALGTITATVPFGTVVALGAVDEFRVLYTNGGTAGTAFNLSVRGR